MDTILEQMANRAVFCLQLNMQDAIKFVCKNAQVNNAQAARAINSAVTFHKKSKVN